MVFTSSSYFIFLPLVFLAFHLSPPPFRRHFLLASSCLFYASLQAPHLLLGISGVIVSSYLFALRIDRSTGPSTRRLLLWGGILTNFSILVVLKYFPQLMKPAPATLPDASAAVPILGAIGASYYVLQGISYLVDVYLKVEEPEPHLGNFALYMSFFPKLLQGPIERAGDLLPQLRRPGGFDYATVREGLLLVAVGLVKKAVIADRLAPMVAAVYSDVHAYHGFPLLLATYYYALQIYFDFSGYTDIALGSALLFNIRLTPNFDRPYFATSIAEFWRRWHISFSRWILDYVFRPLQLSLRNRKDWGVAVSLLLTFLVSGLWHGATWGFVVWGALHGTYMVAGYLYRPLKKKIHRLLPLNEKGAAYRSIQALVTFNLVCFAWIFFRAPTLGDALHVVANLPGAFLELVGTSPYDIALGKLNLSMGRGLSEVLYVAMGIVVVGLSTSSTFRRWTEGSGVLRWAHYYLLFYTFLVFNARNSYQKFLYMQF